MGGTPTGSAVITPAFELSSQGVEHIIHAVGPIWRGGESGEAELLAGAYRASLQLATRASCASVSFPAISTGVYGYPLGPACEVALKTIAAYLDEVPELEVRLVLYDRGSFNTAQRLREQLGL
ncbi:macro domain-containing protein [Deinococcus psychrotolerans]|uniref:macro domain-containing protein n=1 Tax=Deinococcus psychrotolerans TaxID=2489213 RepID=UPI003B969512